GFRAYHVIGLSMVCPALRVPDDDIGCASVFEHLRGNVAGMCARFLRVTVLSTSFHHPRSKSVACPRQKRRRDTNQCIYIRFRTAGKTFFNRGKFSECAAGAVHLPVTSYE